MSNEVNFPQKESIEETLKKYKEQQKKVDGENKFDVNKKQILSSLETEPVPTKNHKEYEDMLTKESDPDLMMSYEIVKLPSKGLFYENGLSEVKIEYLTSRDEDLLTTPSLIESGNVFDEVLKRKIKTPNVNIMDLLAGDRSALLLFLRTTSYGAEYNVSVPHPKTGRLFKTTVDLTKLKYKEVKKPNEDGLFSLELPMRKKLVKFKLLTHGEEENIRKRADALKEEFNEEVSYYNTMKLKAHVVSIGGKTDKSYINKFIDVMPALDAYKLRNEIVEVAPDVDLNYEFKASDGYVFTAPLTIGVDFFFPSI